MTWPPSVRGWFLICRNQRLIQARYGLASTRPSECAAKTVPGLASLHGGSWSHNSTMPPANSRNCADRVGHR